MDEASRGEGEKHRIRAQVRSISCHRGRDGEGELRECQCQCRCQGPCRAPQRFRAAPLGRPGRAAAPGWGAAAVPQRGVCPAPGRHRSPLSIAATPTPSQRQTGFNGTVPLGRSSGLRSMHTYGGPPTRPTPARGRDGRIVSKGKAGSSSSKRACLAREILRFPCTNKTSDSGSGADV